MALKVIGAGFGRTGTLSMKAALQQLGYDKCHHMLEVFPSDAQLDAWHHIAQGGDPDWETVFAGFQASVTANNADLVVFRPDTVGNYTQGQFAILLDFLCNNCANLNIFCNGYDTFKAVDQD